MPDSKFLHEDPEFRELLELVSEEKNIRETLVEKDYWLMHCLWGLQQSGFVFELKGGTSLSKGFNLIDRFSEDVDIRIEPPREMPVKTGKNQDKPAHIESRRRFFEWIAKSIDIHGLTSVERDFEFDHEKLRNAGIRLNYKSYFEDNSAIKPFVLLEVGFDDVTPNEAVTISSWAFDHAKRSGASIIDNRALNIKCYYPEYTLVEKLDAIVRRFEKEQREGRMPKNFLRHYYDISRLLETERVKRFIGTEEYLAHKQNRFSRVHSISEHEAFNLSDPDTKARYMKEYDRIKDFFYETPPEFNEILSVIKAHTSRL